MRENCRATGLIAEPSPPALLGHFLILAELADAVLGRSLARSGLRSFIRR